MVIVALVGCTGGGPGLPTAQTGGDTAPPPVQLVRGSLVVPEGEGLTFLDPDGTVLAEPRWPALVGQCPECAGEGASVDGDGLLVSFTTGTGALRPGAIARLNGDGTLDFRVDGFRFPHDVIRDPADGTLLVVATSSDAVLWIPGDGSSEQPLRSLGSVHPEFPSTPNGAELLVHEGRNYLLLSHRPADGNGRITLWDVTTPGEPAFVWRFPEEGRLAVPHGPVLREVDGVWWLLWAHTNGATTGNGTVGLAVTADPTVAPTYVADLVPGVDVGRFAFLRGVELLGDRLILTDSGQQSFGLGRGRVVSAAFPELAPPVTGERGGRGDQIFEPLGPATPLVEGLSAPFEGWYWADPTD